MKLAVLADIHSNYAALEAVTNHIEHWQPDAVVVAGDIVNRGPRPNECLQFILEKERAQGWLVVRGNHEEYVIHQAKHAAMQDDYERAFFQFSHWTYEQISEQIDQLEAMPFQHSLKDPQGGEVRIVHASMLGNRDGIYPKTTDDELREKIQPAPPLFCVGHTHWPLIRTVDGSLVVNVGAAGLPFDQDVRPSYGQFVWQHNRWQAEIIRLDYDLTQAIQDFEQTGFLEEGGPIAHLILNELRTASPLLFRWTKTYRDRIFSGDVSVAVAVEQFMMAL